MANHNFVTWHREFYSILLLNHCFHWFTCRIISESQRLMHHNYFRIDVLFNVLFLFICLFCSFSLLHAAVANILWREQGTNTDGCFYIFYIMLKFSSIIPFMCLFWGFSDHTLQLQWLPSPSQHWGIWFKEKNIVENNL